MSGWMSGWMSGRGTGRVSSRSRNVKGVRIMGTSASKDKSPATRQPIAHSVALPPPYQLAIEGTGFTMTVLEDHVPRDHDGESALAAATWFSVAPITSTNKRYLYLVQK